MTGWIALLGTFRVVFTAPSFAIFTDLLTGWVCAPGRRIVTAMIAVADPGGRRAHDAYHRFLRDGAWNMNALWRLLCVHAVGRFAPDGVIELVCDDTLHHKTGRHVDGAGTFRDAVRSTVKNLVYAHGLNLVVICLRVHSRQSGLKERSGGPLRVPNMLTMSSHTPKGQPEGRPEDHPHAASRYPSATSSPKLSLNTAPQLRILCLQLRDQHITLRERRLQHSQPRQQLTDPRRLRHRTSITSIRRRSSHHAAKAPT